MKKKLLLFSLVLLIFSCSNHQKVKLNHCMQNVNFSYFKKVYPGIENQEVYFILGEPDKYIENGYTDDEAGFDLYYNTSKGLILLHASNVIDEVGLIEFHPTTPLYLNDIVNLDINILDDTIDFYCDDELKFIIYLNKDRHSIKKINWWRK